MKWLIILIGLAMSSCSLAPKYHRPPMNIPISYKETGKWIEAKPSFASLDRGPWWEMYNDPILNQLEAKVLCANQNLRAAFARYQEALAVVAEQRAAYYPSVVGIFNVFRQQASKTVANVPRVSLFNDKIVSMNLTYEVDLWGRIRNTVASAKSLAQASAADLSALDLSIHAEVAKDYFALRGSDAAQKILDDTVVMYEKALYLIRKRYQGGAVSVIDVDQAINQLNTAKTLAADMRLQRAQLEHAIAVLIGEFPATFSLPPLIVSYKSVTIAPELPSILLERRPDIAEAELKVQAANYDIGVARAAFFPIFNLSGTIGFESSSFGNLFKRQSLVWSLGPTAASALLNNGNRPVLTQVIFDGGRLIALSQQACAKYCETVANYRQTVLKAFQEVEDNLAAVRQLDKEIQTQTTAAVAANKAVTQAMYRYKEGLTTYLDVVVVQNIALQTQLSAIDIQTRRQLASIQLIKALGGGLTCNTA